VISCYANARQLSDPTIFLQFRKQARLLRKTVRPDGLAGFEQALKQINERLTGGSKRDSEGVAVFARGGCDPFYLTLEFRVPLPNRLSISSTPSIYHLVEIKDTYDRYVLVLIDQRSTRILEIHLGAITKAILANRPDIGRCVGKSWTREHHQSHERELAHRHVKGIAGIVDGLLSTRAYAHLVLAGNPEMIAILRSALPKRAASKIIDVIPASTSDCSNDVIAATLRSFVEREQEESLATVERLQNAICSHGLAVAGTHATLNALQHRQVDVLVIAQEYVPEPAWKCSACRRLSIEGRRPKVCAHCGYARTREVDLKEEFARLAEISSCGIEIVHSSETLIRLGGVGCLLRFPAADVYCRTAA
jgi:hypothetical protein